MISSKIARITLLLSTAVLLHACGEAPPMESSQTGFRGVAMLQTSDPDHLEALKKLNQLPEAAPPAPNIEGGPKAGDIYQNVEVLGDLGVAEFSRTMAAITSWVSPDEGCTYCHVEGNFADDSLYTKVVSRRMMQMTQDINANWQSHVGDTGVTCLTCHRGENVPEYIWFDQLESTGAKGMAANSYQQNKAAMNVGSTSMLSDPFAMYLNDEPELIRVVANSVLPQGRLNSNDSSTQATENTYSLMIHMSESLGVNCTYCHNTRAFASWEQSPPARMKAWHGLQMVPFLNAEYLEPLGPTYPPHRLGSLGDAPKVNCETCHQNVSKPFYGDSMLDDYPEWKGVKE